MKFSPLRNSTVLRPQILALLPSFKDSYIKVLLKRLPQSFLASLISTTVKPRTNKADASIRLFVLDHTRFRDDLVALDRFTDIEFCLIPNWVQRWITAFIDDQCSRQSKDALGLRVKYLSGLLSKLSDARNTAGFLSCGFYYAQNHEWELACADMNIPFFCLHREMVGAEPHQMNRIWGNQIKTWRKFKGSLIMIATDSAKKMLTHHNYIDPDKIIVTGAPRFDLVHHNKSKPSKDKLLVFFSFPLTTGQPDLRIKSGTFPTTGGFRNLFRSVHQVVARFAIDHPDITVIIRPKWYASAWKKEIDGALIPILAKLDKKPNNLKIIDNVGAQECLSKAGAVISLNSTTGVEALMYGIPSILPHYHEAIDELKDNLLITSDAEPFYVARSEVELSNHLNNYASGNLPAKAVVDSFYQNIIGPADGQSSARVQNLITNRTCS